MLFFWFVFFNSGMSYSRFSSPIDFEITVTNCHFFLTHSLFAAVTVKQSVPNEGCLNTIEGVELNIPRKNRLIVYRRPSSSLHFHCCRSYTPWFSQFKSVQNVRVTQSVSVTQHNQEQSWRQALFEHHISSCHIFLFCFFVQV